MFSSTHRRRRRLGPEGWGGGRREGAASGWNLPTPLPHRLDSGVRVSSSRQAPLSQAGRTSILASPSGRRHRMSPVVLDGDVGSSGCRDKGLVTCRFAASAPDQGARAQGPPQPPCGVGTVAPAVQTRRRGSEVPWPGSLESRAERGLPPPPWMSGAEGGAVRLSIQHL